MKTARFATVVAACGKPVPHLAWIAPEKDPGFQKALKQQRVMTLHQQLRGSKKDHGEVGFVKAPHVQYLIFPKSLKKFSNHKIVAVDYSSFSDEPAPLPKAAIDPAARSSAVKRTGQKSQTAEALLAFPSDQTKSGREAARKSATRGDDPADKKETDAPPPKRGQHAEPSVAKQNSGAQRSSAPPADDQPLSPPEIAPEIRKTLRELKAGKAVAAYERLQKLLSTLEK